MDFVIEIIRHLEKQSPFPTKPLSPYINPAPATRATSSEQPDRHFPDTTQLRGNELLVVKIVWCCGVYSRSDISVRGNMLNETMKNVVTG